MKLFDQILNEMPQEFSTELFIQKMRQHNATEKYIQSGHHVKFLKSKCQRITKRMYSKAIQNQMGRSEVIQVNYPSGEETCISFLKSKGYKILKPITEYKEL